MGWDWGNAGSGAMSGASAGSAAGPWGAVAGGVAGGLLGGFFGGEDEDYSEAYLKAGDEYERYMREALGETKAHETQGRTDLTDYLNQSQTYGASYRNAGEGALQAYLGSLGLGGSAARQSALQSFQTSPGYQFALNQGLLAQQRNAAAQGMRGSGAEQKALLNYSQNLANQEYGKWQSALSGLVGTGATASEQAAQRAYGTGGSLANLGLGYSGQIGDIYGGIAKAKSEAQMAAAQAAAQSASQNSGGMGSMLGGMGNMFGGS